MPKTLVAKAAKVNPGILEFRPRQVELLIKQSTPTMKKQDNVILQSIAHYLERNGFSKTLKKFIAESKLLKDDLGGTWYDLEEVFCKFLEIRNHTSEKLESNKVQDLQTDGISKKDGEDDSAAAMETVTNGKKKWSVKSGTYATDKQAGAGNRVIDSKNAEKIITNDAVPMDVKSKDKKRNKKNSDALGQEEQVSTEVSKEPDKKHKDKKRKRKMDSEYLVDNVGSHALESLSGATEEKLIDVVFSEDKKITNAKTEHKSREKKKKKDKLSSDPIVDDVEQCVSESKQEANALAFKEVESLKDSQVMSSVVVNAHDILVENKNAKSEGKRKRKDRAIGVLVDLDEGKSNAIDSKKEDFKASKEDLTEKQDKGSKKRKRLALEEDATQPADEKAGEESKCRKTKGSQEPMGSEQSAKLKSSLETDEIDPKEKSSQVDHESLKISVKLLDEQANGTLGENGEEVSLQKTEKKEGNGSVEPKPVKHFQRINVDEVVFSDERLKDNSYWAKSGAENGYGAKAQAVLGQVRGRDFRHEKTKKKRGTYRGGQIDLQSHSIKFNYSDDD